MSSSVRPNRWQPSRLPRPWDSPGKNTGVGCHFLLQCMKVKSESEFAQLCPALRDPMDFSLPGSSIHGIFQVRILEWGAIAFSSTAQGTYQYSVLPYMGKESEKEWMYIYIYIGFPGGSDGKEFACGADLGWEIPWRRAWHSSVLAWRIPWTEEPTVHGVRKNWTRLK